MDAAASSAVPQSDRDAATDGDTLADAAVAVPDPIVVCEPLPASTGPVLHVGPNDDLAQALAAASSGSTLLLATGTYAVPAAGLWFGADGVTLRSEAGDREAVVLDGNYQQTSGGILNVHGRSDITIAHLTIRRARYHAVHATGGPTGPSDRLRLHDLHILDPGEQAIKINANHGHEVDHGELSCSLLELTPEGRTQVMGYDSGGHQCYTGGVDAHRSRGWQVRDNEIRGFWCSNGHLSQHGIHFWRGARDTLVERNRLIDNARGIGFGLGTPGSHRSYDDAPCDGEAEHFGGLIRNNLVIATSDPLFDSPNGMAVGIGLEAACEAVVVHNTVATSREPFAAIDWRFEPTQARIVNNLCTHGLSERNGGTAELHGNLEHVEPLSFLSLAMHDVRLAPGSPAIGAGHPSSLVVAPSDLVGRPRGNPPDVGALEH